MVNYRDFSKFVSEPDTSDDYPMLISLHTSTTLLSTSCLGFSYYNCSNFTCYDPSTSVSTVTTPYFTATGNIANAEVYLDYSYWVSHSALLVSQCESKGSDKYGTGAYGVIGLGVEGISGNNFLNSTLFSIYLEKDASKGMIFFGFDSSKSQKVAPNATLKADQNWNVTGVSNIGFGGVLINIIDNNTSLIFDINTDAIGLPLELYQNFTNEVKEKLMTCDEKISLPSCSYSGKIEDLPDFNITIGDQVLEIPPEFYMRIDEGNDDDSEEVKITLFLRGLSTEETDDSYVTEKYNNTIILGYHVMSYYYVLFDATQGPNNIKINLFIADHLDHTVVYIVLGSIGLCIILSVLFVISVFCCSSRRYKTRDFKGQKKPHEGKQIGHNKDKGHDYMSKSEDLHKIKQEYMPPSPLRPESD